MLIGFFLVDIHSHSAMKKRNRIARARHGVATLESTIVLGFVFVFLVVCLDLALAVTRYISLCEASRRAARAAIVLGGSDTTVGSVGSATWNFTADASNSVADAFRFALMTMDPRSVDSRIEWIDGDNEPDSRLRVTLQYQHRPLLPFYGTIQLNSTSTMGIAH